METLLKEFAKYLKAKQAQNRHLLPRGLNISDVYDSFSFNGVPSNQIHYPLFQIQTKYKSVIQSQMLKTIRACFSHLLRASQPILPT